MPVTSNENATWSTGGGGKGNERIRCGDLPIGRRQIRRLARAIQGAVGGTVGSDYRSWHVTDAKARTWRVVPDGSLSGGERSGEIVSLILAHEDIDDLQSVVRAVRTAGARSESSTGIHIHVDGSRFEAKGVTNLVKTIHKRPYIDWVVDNVRRFEEVERNVAGGTTEERAKALVEEMLAKRLAV